MQPLHGRKNNNKQNSNSNFYTGILSSPPEGHTGNNFSSPVSTPACLEGPIF